MITKEEVMKVTAEMKARNLWTEHPFYPLESWQHEVAEGYTRQGYWDWINSQIEQDDDLPWATELDLQDLD